MRSQKYYILSLQHILMHSPGKEGPFGAHQNYGKAKELV